MVWAQGQRLQGGKYVIEAVLGQGGFGITYKALHVPSNELVVIKTPNEYLQFDPNYDKYIARFIQEGQILARLSQDPHPHIVGVRDLFKDGETHCLVMDFIDGENLFQLVTRRGAIPEAAAVKCIRQIAEALVVVHEAGLVHRDAHPGNIMLRQNGKAVLIDFGIAKGLVPSTKTSTSKAGNEGFAPYEQMVRGSREPTVDVYCLAATLYYAVTGQRPTPALVRRLDDEPLIPPKQVISGISNKVNKAILKGMELEAKNRPQSMEEWLKLLEAPEVVTPPPVDPVHQREVVRSLSMNIPVANTRESDSQKIITIPWGWLIVVLVSYSLIGISLGGAIADVKNGLIDQTGAGVVAGAEAVAVAVAGAVAVVWAGKRLLECFSEFDTFLILIGTSSFGLGLGWLLSSIFQ
ncbi:MAG TPA: serine/threonine protein kinase [Cyanobacteria bacterium UBA12227]|nr:serine/threonine protein kinase [Cyanobacteria bacterium UBA12227]HAX90203.1 serine/threonine protein kinase [Cyanobacteria bacterium UBA11370]HBY76728.1 serine/threonine protein kinase [Cyanobacteria bacterium UBA11148]